MSADANQAAQRTAAVIAFRHIDEVSEHDREQVLIALVELLPEAEARLAQDALFHLRAQRAAQFELKLALNARETTSPKN